MKTMKKMVATIAVLMMVSATVFAQGTSKDVDNSLKEMETVIAKMEKFAKDAENGKVDSESGEAQLASLVLELVAVAAKYQDLPDESSWTAKQKAKQEELQERSEPFKEAIGYVIKQLNDHR